MGRLAHAATPFGPRFWLYLTFQQFHSFNKNTYKQPLPAIYQGTAKKKPQQHVLSVGMELIYWAGKPDVK